MIHFSFLFDVLHVMDICFQSEVFKVNFFLPHMYLGNKDPPERSEGGSRNGRSEEICQQEEEWDCSKKTQKGN